MIFSADALLDLFALHAAELGVPVPVDLATMHPVGILRSALRNGDPRHIELDEAVPGLLGDVEVVVRPVTKAPDASVPDVLDVIASLSPGARSKEEIDEQLAEERASWGER